MGGISPSPGDKDIAGLMTEPRSSVPWPLPGWEVLSRPSAAQNPPVSPPDTPMPGLQILFHSLAPITRAQADSM